MPITTHCTCGQSIDGRCHSSIDGCEQLFLTNVDNHYNMEPKHHPGSSYQNLFDYLIKEHGLTLLQGQMDDLISMVHKHHPAGAVWVKASERLPGWRTTVRWRIGGREVHKCDVAYMSQAESPAHWMDYEWYDEGESPAAAREEDAVEFAEWMRLNCKSSQSGWVDALGKWDTTKGWYELFKQQKEK